jgi:hypothetical protein
VNAHNEQAMCILVLVYMYEIEWDYNIGFFVLTLSMILKYFTNLYMMIYIIKIKIK